MERAGGMTDTLAKVRTVADMTCGSNVNRRGGRPYSPYCREGIFPKPLRGILDEKLSRSRIRVDSLRPG